MSSAHLHAPASGRMVPAVVHVQPSAAHVPPEQTEVDVQAELQKQSLLASLSKISAHDLLALIGSKK